MLTDPPKTVFIYALKEPDTGEIRYVGKSKHPKKRFWKHIYTANRKSNHRECWIAGLVSSGKKPVMEILDEVSEEYWPQWEIAWIDFCREDGCQLVNSKEGGEGGHNPCRETREKLSRLNSGVNHPMFGKKRPLRSVEWIRKISLSRAGKQLKGIKQVGSSKLIGVSWDKSRNKWQASITVLRKQFGLGRYESEEEAAHAYDWVARLYHGESARINFP